MTCAHCKREMKSLKRDLCATCYARPEILANYPPKRGFYGHKNDFNGGYELPEPTRSLPGTQDRIWAYQERVKRKQALHHPLDARRELS